MEENTKRLWLSRDDYSCGGELWLWPQEPTKRNGVWCVLNEPCGLKLEIPAAYLPFALKLRLDFGQCIQFSEVKDAS